MSPNRRPLSVLKEKVKKEVGNDKYQIGRNANWFIKDYPCNRFITWWCCEGPLIHPIFRAVICKEKGTIAI